jgi:hypothetical protein
MHAGNSLVALNLCLDVFATYCDNSQIASRGLRFVAALWRSRHLLTGLDGGATAVRSATFFVLCMGNFV